MCSLPLLMTLLLLGPTSGADVAASDETGPACAAAAQTPQVVADRVFFSRPQNRRATTSRGVEEPAPAQLERLAADLLWDIDQVALCTGPGQRATAACVCALKPSSQKVRLLRANGVAGADPVQQILLERRQQLSSLKRWVRAYEESPDSQKAEGGASAGADVCREQIGEAARKIDAAYQDLAAALTREGLRDTSVTAELITGPVLGHTQGSAPDGPQTDVPVYLLIKSRPFGLRGSLEPKWAFHPTFRFGLLPTLSLVETDAQAQPPTNPAENPTPAAATDTLSTVVEGRIDFGATFHDSAEVSVSAAVGQIWVNTKTLLRDDILYVTVPSQGEKDGIFCEAGVRLRYFDDINRGARQEQQSVEARVEFSAAYRRDARLQVAGTGFGFQHPEDRLVLRLLFDGIPVVNAQSAEGKKVEIGIGVEHERGLRSKGAPAVTRIFLRGDVNLLKALAGGMP